MKEIELIGMVLVDEIIVIPHFKSKQNDCFPISHIGFVGIINTQWTFNEQTSQYFNK